MPLIAFAQGLTTFRYVPWGTFDFNSGIEPDTFFFLAEKLLAMSYQIYQGSVPIGSSIAF